MAAQPYNLVNTPIGTAREYSDIPLARAALQAALVYWYQRARTLTTTTPQFPGSAWVQVQTQPTLKSPGSLLYNCGGIDPSGDGDYGKDYAKGTLKDWLRNNLTVTVAPNTNVTFAFDNPDATAMTVTEGYVQDYYIFTCQAGIVEYNAKDSNGTAIKKHLEKNADESKTPIDGCKYKIIVNFHLYVDGPEEV